MRVESPGLGLVPSPVIVIFAPSTCGRRSQRSQMAWQLGRKSSSLPMGTRLRLHPRHARPALRRNHSRVPFLLEPQENRLANTDWQRKSATISRPNSERRLRPSPGENVRKKRAEIAGRPGLKNNLPRMTVQAARKLKSSCCPRARSKWSDAPAHRRYSPYARSHSRPTVWSEKKPTCTRSPWVMRGAAIPWPFILMPR